MLKHQLLIGVAVAGLICGCERKERNVDVSPARPAEQPMNSPNANPNNEGTHVGTERTRTGEPTLAERRGTNEPIVQQGGVSPAAAVQSIAQSRCSREARCKNVGADHKYKSMADCTAKLADDKQDDLNLKDCPRGISQKELSECLREIQNEDCNNPLDTLGRLAACRSSDLCMSTNP